LRLELKTKYGKGWIIQEIVNTAGEDPGILNQILEDPENPTLQVFLKGLSNEKSLSNKHKSMPYTLNKGGTRPPITTFLVKMSLLTRATTILSQIVRNHELVF
jgi:hypothetical protein